MPQPNIGLAGKPDFPHLDEEPTDRVDRLLARRKRAEEIEEARRMIREAVADEAIKRRLDALPKLLGPEPQTGEEWANRGLRALELATITDLGFHPSAAAALEAACMKRAAVLEPQKFGRGAVGAGSGDGGNVYLQVEFVVPSAGQAAPVAVFEREAIEGETAK